jgi:hypothetical protein
MYLPIADLQVYISYWYNYLCGIRTRMSNATNTKIPPWEANLPNVAIEWLAPLFRIWEIAGFKSQFRLSWVKFYAVSITPSKQRPWEYLKLGHGRFLPHPSQLIIH